MMFWTSRHQGVQIPLEKGRSYRTDLRNVNDSVIWKNGKRFTIGCRVQRFLLEHQQFCGWEDKRAHQQHRHSWWFSVTSSFIPFLFLVFYEQILQVFVSRKNCLTEHKDWTQREKLIEFVSKWHFSFQLRKNPSYWDSFNHIQCKIEPSRFEKRVKACVMKGACWNVARDVVTVLVNAIHFKAKWKNEFDENETNESVFHAAVEKRMVRSVFENTSWVTNQYDSSNLGLKISCSI